MAKKIKAPQEKTEVKVSLKFGTTTLEGKGETIVEALSKIEKPVKITSKSLFTVSNGDKTHSRPMTIPQAKRLFMPVSQAHFAKNLELLLK